MILKISYNGWKFYDNVKEPSISYCEPDEEGKYHISWDETYLCEHEIPPMPQAPNEYGFIIECKTKNQHPAQSIFLITYQRKDGTYWSILSDCTTYLMNDEGKTIERIN